MTNTHPDNDKCTHQTTQTAFSKLLAQILYSSNVIMHTNSNCIRVCIICLIIGSLASGETTTKDMVLSLENNPALDNLIRTITTNNWERPKRPKNQRNTQVSTWHMRGERVKNDLMNFYKI